MKVLIDADMLLFRAAAGCMVEADLGDDCWIWHSDLPQTRASFWEMVGDLCEQVEASTNAAILCWTHNSGFRRALFPDYKSGRGTKPPGFGAARAELLAHQSSVCHAQIEADDLMGLFSDMLPPGGYAVASGDKDLDQVPGAHIWLGTEPRVVTPHEAQLLFWMQAITGDATDKIPGCPGAGPAKAAKALQGLDPFDAKECWAAVVGCYEKAKVPNPQEAALLTARLVRILRAGEYDFDLQQVELWTPPA